MYPRSRASPIIFLTAVWLMSSVSSGSVSSVLRSSLSFAAMHYSCSGRPIRAGARFESIALPPRGSTRLERYGPVFQPLCPPLRPGARSKSMERNRVSKAERSSRAIRAPFSAMSKSIFSPSSSRPSSARDAAARRRALPLAGACVFVLGPGPLVAGAGDLVHRLGDFGACAAPGGELGKLLGKAETRGRQIARPAHRRGKLHMHRGEQGFERIRPQPLRQRGLRRFGRQGGIAGQKGGGDRAMARPL